MIFIDGVGIGKKDYEFNPFFKYGFKSFLKIFGEIPSLENSSLTSNGFYLFPTDARLGVDGLPQSGTGQTSIFCGINAPQFVGKHFGPYPYSTTIPIINEKNIFLHYKNLNRKAFFANAYPQVFFDYINSGKSRLSVTSLSYLSARMKLNDETDVLKGSALTAEITNERWNSKLGYNLPIISPQTAAERLLSIADENDFTLYEFFLTDHIGHGRIKNEFDQIFSNIDLFLLHLIKNIPNDLTFIVCSDHGNLEDLSIKTHTLNPSLTITGGKHASKLANAITNITQFKKAISDFCL
ncbi:MAG: alkaline phosphatase family protein [Ignavibacteriales bacterium]|nr:alkaline phosphatase family protein [Ignavibacteriales bacterium]